MSDFSLNCATDWNERKIVASQAGSNLAQHCDGLLLFFCLSVLCIRISTLSYTPTVRIVPEIWLVSGDVFPVPVK